MPIQTLFSSKRLIWAWIAVAFLLTVPVGALLRFHHLFDYERDLVQIPALYLAGALVFSGLVFLVLQPLLEHSSRLSKQAARNLFVFILAFGLLARVAMFFTTPALEDDYYRYMWDGSVTANLLNPFAYAPGNAGDESVPVRLDELAKQAGLVHERINHANLKTVYPPLAQGAFAVAYFIKPFSLTAWRTVCLTGEVATLFLILALLRATGRSPEWVALYWWNPIVIKEMINSAHMEAVLMPFVLAALLAAARRRHLLATILIGLGAGVKLWPIVLAPLVLRPLLNQPRKLFLALGVLMALCALWGLPLILGGLDESSGFLAYATKWKTNSALSAALTLFDSRLLQPLGMPPELSNRLLRLSLGLVLSGFVFWKSMVPVKGIDDLIARASAIIIALFLLSPAQFPWYLVWILPMMPLYPVSAMLLASALVPLYYTSFYFYALGTYHVFTSQIVWVIWIPIWGMLFFEIVEAHNRLDYRRSRDD